MKRTLIGLDNNSNICYLNSVLQLLFTIEPLSHYLLLINNHPSKLIRDYTSLVYSQYFKPTPKSRNTTQFTNQFTKSNNQEDAHEFLIFLLNLFHDSLITVFPKNRPENHPENFPKNATHRLEILKWNSYNKSIITELLKGHLINSITCSKCYTENNVFEPFFDLTLKLTPEHTNNTTIYDLIKETFYSSKDSSKDIITNYNCDKCRRTTQATKKTRICRLPPFLIIHLNRTSTTFQKNTTYIQFPLKNMKLTEFFCGKKAISYDLKAAICHHGSSISNGHYNINVVNDNKWICINDSMIENVNNTGDECIFLYVANFFP